MRRRSFLSSLGCATFALVFPVCARPPGQVNLVGVFWGGGIDPDVADKRLSKQLSSHGLIEGKNLRIVSRYSYGSQEQLTALAKDLVAENPDVILVEGTTRTRILQSLTTSVPIVFLSANPVPAGLVKNLARPGGNATGVFTQECALIEKRRELLRELAPGARRVVFVGDRPSDDRSPCQPEFDAMTGVDFVQLELSGAEAAKKNVERVLRAAPDALLSMSNYPGIDEVLAVLAMKRHVPVVSGDPVDDRVGVLASVYSDPNEAFDVMLIQAARILAGARPAELPVQVTTRIRTEINLRLAKELGIHVPDAVLLRATRLLQ